MGQAVGDAAAVADDVQARIAGHQVLVQRHLHVVELHLHAVEERVVVGGARRDLVEGVDHLDDPVQDALGEHQGEVPGRGGQRRRDQPLLDPLHRAPPAPDQVPEPLDHDAARQHVAEPGDGCGR